MKEAETGSHENDGETSILLETVVAAHYLALQLRLLARGSDFKGRDATEFLAAALTEWAALAEKEALAQQERPGAAAFRVRQ